MKRYIYILTAICALQTICLTTVVAQKKNIEEIDYRRNSIYSILVNHTKEKYADNIADAFVGMPLPDKYNDHDLSVKVVSTATDFKQSSVDRFIEENNIASHLVSRWFNRDIETGACDLNLIKERGLYNASEFDRMIAEQTIRGNAMLEDAGEDLIQNTFVIVNDIKYVDQEAAGQAAGVALQVLFGLAGSFTSAYTGANVQNSFNTVGEGMNQMMRTLKGFKVKVHTYLYRLRWDEETAARFYTEMYSDKPDETKKTAFENNRKMFKVEYVGSQLSSGKDISFMGVNLDTPDAMVRKACMRAIDENVANLSRNFEPFKVKVKLTNTKPIQAPIGMKEDVTEKTKYEVLLPEIVNGKTKYRHIAVIQPIAGMIWDNRYMAYEEGAVGSTLNYTTFTKISGGEIMPGMLIREMGKSKK